MKTTFALLLMLGIIFINADLAQANKNQRQRIRQGIKSGTVTKGEAKKLRHEKRANKAEMHKMKKAARADGNVTRDERQKMNQERRKHRREMNKKIRGAKNNDIRRPKTPHRGNKPAKGKSSQMAPAEEG